jgi:hypothetical protein
MKFTNRYFSIAILFMSVLCEGNKLGTLVQPDCHHRVIV